MVLQGMRRQLGTLGCDLAAVLSERDLFKGSGTQDHRDLRNKMEEYYRQSRGGTGSGVIQRIYQASQRWKKMLDIRAHPGNQKHNIDLIGILLAQAYPDRIAQRQANESRRYKLANGRLAQFRHPDPLEHQEYLVVADLDGTQPLAHIYMAAPIHRENLFKDFEDLLQTKECVEWNEATQSVGSNREQRLGQLILEESRLSKPNSELVVAALLKGIRINGLSCLPWTKTQHNWQARVQFLRQVMGPETDWPDVSNNTILKTLETWLAPYLTEISSLAQLKRLDLTWPLHALLSAEQQRNIDTLAPTHLTIPSGSRIALDYESGETPILAVRLQELFGMTETPVVANGKVPVLIHLLSPARRPVQATQDLKSFWKTGYVEVKKELKGRYPKHFWPDDPLHAPPTRGIKKR